MSKKQKEALNIARAYLTLPQNIRQGFRKARKAYVNSRIFQDALTQAGNEMRLERHALCCQQAYTEKRNKVGGKIGNHKLVCENTNLN